MYLFDEHPIIANKTLARGRLKIIKDYCYTISTKQMRVPNAGIIAFGNGKYRYLTERECFRLMGFTDDDFDKLRKVYPEKKKTRHHLFYINKQVIVL